MAWHQDGEGGCNFLYLLCIQTRCIATFFPLFTWSRLSSRFWTSSSPALENKPWTSSVEMCTITLSVTRAVARIFEILSSFFRVPSSSEKSDQTRYNLFSWSFKNQNEGLNAILKHFVLTGGKFWWGNHLFIIYWSKKSQASFYANLFQYPPKKNLNSPQVPKISEFPDKIQTTRPQCL